MNYFQKILPNNTFNDNSKLIYVILNSVNCLCWNLQFSFLTTQMILWDEKEIFKNCILLSERLYEIEIYIYIMK